MITLAKDKIVHLKAGAAVAAAALAAAAILLALGAHPLAVAVLVTGGAVAAAVEFAQRDSNRRLADAGRPALHDVSWSDLAASLAPAVVVAGAVQLLVVLA